MNDATELADELDTALNTFRTAKSNQAAGEAHYALRQLLWDNKALIVTALRAIPSQPSGLSKESCRILNEVNPSECLCDTERHIDPQCCAAGMCARERSDD